MSQIEELIQKRRSALAFLPDPIDTKLMAKLMESARWAPSSFNEQPWRFVFASRQEHPKAFDLILSCLFEGNQLWAKKAPLLMLAIAKKTFSYNGKANKHAFYDLGQALAFFSLHATQEGLVLHQMAGFDPKRAGELLQLPEDFEALTAVAVGYPGDIGALPESLRQRAQKPSGRKELSEIAFIFDPSAENPWAKAVQT